MISQPRLNALTAVAGAATAVAVTVACFAQASTAAAGVTPASPFISAGSAALNGATEQAGFTATLADAPAQVSSVKWVLDGTYLGKVTTAPYQLVLPKQASGAHTLRARIYAADGTEIKLEARFTGATAGSPAPQTAPPVAAPPPAAPSGPGGASAGVVHVSNGAALAAALAAAKPGTTIALADGTYTSKAAFTIATACTATAPCALTGSRLAVLDGAGFGGHYGLHLLKANYWTLSGFTVSNAAKGIVTDASSHNVISGVQVSFIGAEGIHLRDFSSDNLIKASLVHDTGKKSPQYGEGIYVGSAKSNWTTYSGGRPDNSDRNQILGNTIFRTGAENVDIKEGTTGGVLAGNSFNGAGMSGQNFADSWVDVKGNGWTISRNVGTDSINDGFQSHVVLLGWGQGNTFSANTAKVNNVGYGFNIQSAATSHTVVACDNVVTGAGSGFANTHCTA